VIFALRMFRSKPQQSTLEYAGNAAPGAPGAQNNLSTAFGGGAPRVEPTTSRFPAGFDAAQFAHHAKLNFTKLQAANDQGDLSTMREFMTPELYAQIAADLEARGTATQKTDVVTLNAEVLEVVTEGDAYIASVNFTGMIREEANAAAAPFSEIWHLEKPVNGNSGWLISGIQQN
jgi:predicted lipid-binding transport protein (Tim44 family)